MKCPVILWAALASTLLTACAPHPSISDAKIPHTLHAGMVVSAQQQATKVGYSVLQKGGNAIDAAVAMGYALAVVDPSCGNLAGGGYMTLHLANGRNLFVDFREQAPGRLLQVQGLSKEKLDANPGLGFATPGTVMGLNAVLARYGTWNRSQTLQPAIDLAHKGYVLTQGDIGFLIEGKKYFVKYPEEAALFMPGGSLVGAGDRVYRPELVPTLTLLATQGTRAFYNGLLTQKMIATAKAYGGVIREEDFKKYQVHFRAPLVCHYHGYTLVTAPPSSAGGLALCEMLGLLEGAALRPESAREKRDLRMNLEAMYYAYQDADRWAADPAFHSVPTAMLLSPAHLHALRTTIQRDLKKAKAPRPSALIKEGENTTSFVTADRWGNVVAVTYTLNDFYGRGLMVSGTGIFLNNENKDFNFDVKSKNRPEPFKRPVSYIAPSLLFDAQGQWILAMATPGGASIPTQLLELLENHLDYGMNLRSAVDRPRYHLQAGPGIINVERGAVSAEVEAQLQQLGYKMQQGSTYGYDYWGGVTAIGWNAQKHRFEGKIDKRRPGGAVKGG